MLRKSLLFLSALVLILSTTAATTEPKAPHDPNEVRPEVVNPRLSLPSQLRKVPAINPAGEYFVPPSVYDIPDSKYGDMVELGRKIFTDTQTYGARYVGNGLNCSSCHLAEGRKPNAGPIWAAYGKYPMFRNKNMGVVTYQERVQDCFRYSMDGIAPTLDSPEMKALVSYSHWLSKGAPTGVTLPGRGFVAITKPRDPTPVNGEEIYHEQCAFCHGADGLGQKHKNKPGYMFPPLWGSDSYNEAAGMNKVKTCAEFVKANMPLGKGFSLTDAESWDVCVYMWIQGHPWDPRKGTFMNIFTPSVGNNG